MAVATISPVTREVLKSFDELTREELEDKRAQAAPDAVDVAATYRVPRRAKKGL